MRRAAGSIYNGPVPADRDTVNDPRPSTADSILATARALYCEQREGLPTMDDVARAAGIGRATLYRHFGNRDRL